MITKSANQAAGDLGRLQQENERAIDETEELTGQIKACKDAYDKLNDNYRSLKKQSETMSNKFAASVVNRSKSPSGVQARNPSVPLPRVGNLRPEQIKPLYGY